MSDVISQPPAPTSLFGDDGNVADAPKRQRQVQCRKTSGSGRSPAAQSRQAAKSDYARFFRFKARQNVP